MTAPNEPSTGLVVRTHNAGGLPILWTYVPEMPTEVVQRSLPWLTEIRWQYNGMSDDGMPSTEENELMQSLEGALSKAERPGFCAEAYRPIGAGLREFVLYVADRDKFLSEFNDHVAGHPRYPIEIKFYRDEEWSELRELINDLGAA